jgi:hypothetical protein
MGKGKGRPIVKNMENQVCKEYLKTMTSTKWRVFSLVRSYGTNSWNNRYIFQNHFLGNQGWHIHSLLGCFLEIGAKLGEKPESMGGTIISY